MEVTLLSQKTYFNVKQICYTDFTLLNLHKTSLNKCYKWKKIDGHYSLSNFRNKYTS